MDPLEVNHKERNVGKTNANEDEFWPLSGEPFFSVILTKSHVSPVCQMALPVKIYPSLPLPPCPVVLSYHGKKWNMTYVANGHRKRFDPKWRQFVIDNDLNAGDACVFEISKCNDTIIEFRVQILRGDIPSELLEDGSANTPITID